MNSLLGLTYSLYEGTPTPLLESFHIAFWYVLRYYGPAIGSEELLSMRVTLSVLAKWRSHASVSPDPAALLEVATALELLLRLALRTPVWFRVRQLEEQYAEYMRVGPALQRLRLLPASLEGDGEDNALLARIDGAGVWAMVTTNGDADAAAVLRTARVRELRQLVLATQPRPSAVVWKRKENLIRCILSALRGCTGVNDAAPLVRAWDTHVGPLCRVHGGVRGGVQRISVLLHSIARQHGTWGMLQSHHSLPPTTALLQLAPRLLARQEIANLTVPVPPWWGLGEKDKHGNGDGEGSQTQPLQPLYLCISTDAFTNYMEALHLLQELLEVSEGKSKVRHWDSTFTVASLEVVQKGLAQIHCLQQKHGEVSMMTMEGMKTGLKRDRDLSHEENMVHVETLLRYGGLMYEHLLPFLPKYQWFACLELLVPMLQYHKKWDLANELLRKLLEEPVHVVKSPCGTVTLPFFYRFQKRGKWSHQFALNLTHLGDKTGALRFLELKQESWREVSSPRFRLTFEKPNALPDPIKRRVRLLRALFHPLYSPKDAALYNAVGECHRQHFCRRSHRLSIEKTLAFLHRTLRRWTPLPPSYVCFTNSLRTARTLTVPSIRDSEDSQLWRDPFRASASCRVEDHVLRWFIASRRERDEEWIGLHCEGRWVLYVAHILLWDAYRYDPDKQKASCHADHVWLSPLQQGPLDLTSTTNFVWRRRRIIEERLNFFEQCPRDTLVEYAKTHCSGWNEDASPRQSAGESMGMNAVLPARPQMEEQNMKRNTDEVGKENRDVDSETSLLASDDEEKYVKGNRRSKQEYNKNKNKNKNKNDDEEEEDEEESDEEEDDLDVLPGQPSPHEMEESPLPTCQLVELAGFPLLLLLQVVPQRALCALLRLLFLSSPEDGHTIDFSGFPDLVMWRESPCVAGDLGFILSEVKSPNDTLSEKQIDVLDVLCRCGFDATVARVIDLGDETKEQAGGRGVHLVTQPTADSPEVVPI